MVTVNQGEGDGVGSSWKRCRFALADGMRLRVGFLWCCGCQVLVGACRFVGVGGVAACVSGNDETVDAGV